MGTEFRINGGAGKWEQYFPSVTSDPLGNFVVVWQHTEFYGYEAIHGQRYDSSGAPLGGFGVAGGFRRYRDPSVTSDVVGNFVVVWQISQKDGSYYGVFGQRYDSGGVAQGSEFLINSYTTDDQRSSSVAATGAERFIVAWESSTQDGSGFGVFGQRFDFTGPQTITVVSPNTEK